MFNYQMCPNVNSKEIAKLRESVGWNAMEEYYDRALKNSYFYVCCYNDTELIGFVDVISNKSTDAYIQDVMVKPHYHGNGIGTKLMNIAIDKLKQDNIYMISVIFDRHLLGFYNKFGFNIALSGQIETHVSEL